MKTGERAILAAATKKIPLTSPTLVSHAASLARARARSLSVHDDRPTQFHINRTAVRGREEGNSRKRNGLALLQTCRLPVPYLRGDQGPKISQRKLF